MGLNPGLNNLSPGETLATEETLQSIAGFNIPKYDEIVLSYTGADLTGVVYKLASTVVSTLTLSYTGGNLTGVIKS